MLSSPFSLLRKVKISEECKTIKIPLLLLLWILSYLIHVMYSFSLCDLQRSPLLHPNKLVWGLWENLNMYEMSIDTPCQNKDLWWRGAALLTQITVSLAIIALCPAPLDC